MSMSSERLTALALIHQGNLTHFIGRAQRAYLREVIQNSEEGDYFAKLLIEWDEKIKAMPATREGDTTAHLHYFMGNTDAWITEKDIGDGTDDKRQHQAFGKISLNGDYPELGYISIFELIGNGVELDLYWTPKSIEECGNEH